MDSAHYKVILSYNGLDFAGFQRQKDERTVQGEFEESLRRIGWHAKSIQAAGRTDAGVHARAQVVSFQLDWEHSTDDLRNALNYYLPRDMAVQSVMVVPANFHPRFDAKLRHYRYNCFCQPVRDPIREVFAWRAWPEVKIDRMNVAAKALIGSHDFIAFGSATSKGGVTVREVFSAEWQQKDDVFQFDITANAFLYHMVRRITFALVAVGQEHAPISLIADNLKSGQCGLTGIAPAVGLVLEGIIY
ncbi:MAG: tRNA pseudouridine(38-40) synthase TruA [Chloroflexota bacterium]|nr:tRNA pseudouridine(38-40) synthase TruA [Chloroflexota bacterium]